MCENCYTLKTSFELFIERQKDFYLSCGLSDEEATDNARHDLEQYIDSLPVIISKNLYTVYKQIG